jgi:hypothetical protein
VKSKKAKKPVALYDENGDWLLQKSMIKGAMRRTFRLSPQMREVMNEARVELPPKTLKDGSVGKKNQIRYRCACCGELFPQRWVQVDHKNPVVPLHCTEKSMTYDELASNVFCKKSNLQVMCSTPLKFLPKGQRSCHGRKSAEENFIRDQYNSYEYSVGEGMLESFKKKYQDYLSEKKKIEQEKEAKRQTKLLKKTKTLPTGSK